MKEEELLCLERKQKAEREKYSSAEHRAIRLSDIREFLTPPVGLFRNKCPNDGTKLTRTTFEREWGGNVHFTCPKCAYEYARPVTF